MLLRKSSFFLVAFSLLFLFISFACAPKPEENKKKCKTNSSCKTLSDYCKKGSCVPISCSENDDCRGGWHCSSKNKKCQEKASVECSEDDDCTGSKKCTEGKCIEKKDECKDNSDCKDSSKPLCKESKCIEKKDECKDNSDCKDSSKPLCKEGKCIEKKDECTIHTDCTDSKKPRCTNGKCVEDNRPDKGAACKLGETECRPSLICDRPDPAKADGTCRESCDVFSPACKKPQVCMQREGKDGICVDPNKGGKLGEACDEKSTPCEKNLHCTEWLKKKACRNICDGNQPSCENKEECYEISKKKFVCVPEREPCGPGRPCSQEKYQCVNNRCSPPPSCDQITCKKDEVCENSACRKKKCPKEMQCQAPNKCDASTGICAPPAGQDPPCKPCSSKGTCSSSSEVCLGGGSLSNDPKERFCIAQCPSGTCANPKHFSCVQISVSSGSCRTASQCRPPYTTCTNQKCTRISPLCMPTIGTCKNRCKTVTNCSAPKKCIPATGACITPGKAICATCKHNDECGSKKDICLIYPDKTSHCGKDCLSSSCPSGYKCFPLSGGTTKQCAPTSLKCP